MELIRLIKDQTSDDGVLREQERARDEKKKKIIKSYDFYL